MRSKRGSARSNAVWIVIFLLVSGLVLAACGSDDDKSDENKVYRIGVLQGSAIFGTTVEALKAELTTLGYTEGENITYDVQDAGSDPAKMREIADQFVADKVDLIFTTTNNAALAARDATAESGTPVVFTFVIAPVETGTVANLRDPGGNLTGVRNPLDISVGKRVEYLTRIDPGAKRLWVPYDPQYPTSTVIRQQLENSAPGLGVDLLITEITGPADVVAELAQYSDADTPPFDAVIIFPELTVQMPESWNAILAFCQTHSLPILANTPGQLTEGALFSYLADNAATGTQAARLVHQILSGITPDKLPVETSELYLTINLDAAEALGIEVPDLILEQADTVINN